MDKWKQNLTKKGTYVLLLFFNELRKKGKIKSRSPSCEREIDPYALCFFMVCHVRDQLREGESSIIQRSLDANATRYWLNLSSVED